MNSIQCLAFSPNGEWLASSGSNDSVKIWNARSGKELLSWSSPAGWARHLAISPDSLKIATADEKSVKIWDARNGNEIANLSRAGQAWAVSFSPDGKWLAVALNGPRLAIFDTTDFNESVSINHAGGISLVAFTPDSRHLVTNGQPSLVAGGRDGLFQIWDVLTGDAVSVLKGHKTTVRALAVSPNGKRIASIGSYENLRIWDAATGQELLSFPTDAHHLSFSPNGEQLAYVTSEGVRVLNAPIVETDKLLPDTMP